jgi:colicin import membrane protein
MLAGPVEVVKPKGSPRSAMDESAVKAVMDGQPYSMLKPESYDNWKDITFTFDRRQGSASQ